MQISPTRTTPSVASIPSVAPSQSVATSHRPAVVAHRGAHDRTTIENTVDAYRRAAQMGADLVEVDIRRTRDGVLVLHHDAWIAGRRIASTNFADLPKLPNGQALSTLQGLVDAATGAYGGMAAPRLLVETKEFGYEAEIVATLRSSLSASQFELMSFNQRSVRAMHALAPDAKVGVLFGLIPDWDNLTWPITGAGIVEKARELGVDFVALDRRIANNSRLATVAAAGIDIGVWTVDDDDDLARYLSDTRISRVITDRPDAALRIRG